MAWREQQGCYRQQNRACYNSAEQKHHGRNYRQSKRSENAALFETNRPDCAVCRSKNRVNDDIERKRAVKPPPENRSGNVEYHQCKAAKSPRLLYNLDSLVIPLVLKAVLTFHRENYVRNQYYRNKNQSVNIKPAHCFPPKNVCVSHFRIYYSTIVFICQRFEGILAPREHKKQRSARYGYFRAKQWQQSVQK